MIYRYLTMDRYLNFADQLAAESSTSCEFEWPLVWVTTSGQINYHQIWQPLMHRQWTNGVTLLDELIIAKFDNILYADNQWTNRVTPAGQIITKFGNLLCADNQ